MRDISGKSCRGDADKYLEQKVVERQREYQKFGETVYLLEPNVKKSQGGLRDLHLLQWVGLARYQAPTIRELSDRGILSQADYRAIKEAREFLLRVRSFLHIRAGMAQEILTFDEQVWLATNSDSPIGRICLPSNSSCSSTTAIPWGCMRLDAIRRTMSPSLIVAAACPMVAVTADRSVFRH